MKKFLLIIICCFIWFNGYSQLKHSNIDNLASASKILDFKVDYSYLQPDGDLAKRFGPIHQLSAGAIIKLKNNWCAETSIGYQFGYTIKEQGILYYLTNSSGVISNTGGYPANFNIGERGLNFSMRLGKIFPVFIENRNSGIMILIGGGYYMHKVNITNTSNDIPSLTTDLKRGYDRLTAGWGASEFIGYIFHSQNRYINFYIGFDLVQASTKSLRGYNYDQRMADNKQRFDATYGLRVGWMFPVYLGSSDEDEFDFK